MDETLVSKKSSNAPRQIILLADACSASSLSVQRLTLHIRKLSPSRSAVQLSTFATAMPATGAQSTTRGLCRRAEFIPNTGVVPRARRGSPRPTGEGRRGRSHLRGCLGRDETPASRISHFFRAPLLSPPPVNPGHGAKGQRLVQLPADQHKHGCGLSSQRYTRRAGWLPRCCPTDSPSCAWRVPRRLSRRRRLHR